MSTGWTDAEVRIFSVTDGDTVRLFRRWEVQRETCPAGSGLLMDEIKQLRDNPEHWPKGLAARLVHLDTPELRTDPPGWTKARQDLLWWIEQRAGRLRCVFSEQGGFDRILVDIYTADNRADTASQWMLLHGNDGAGWPPYLKGQ